MATITEKLKAAVLPDPVARFEAQAATVAEEITKAEGEAEAARSELAACIESGKSPEASEARIEAAEARSRRLSERRGVVAAALSKAKTEAATKEKAAALAAAQKALAEADVIAAKAHSVFTDSLTAAGRARTGWEDAEAAATAARGALMRLGVDVPPAARYAHTAEEAARVALGGGHGSLEVRLYRPPVARPNV